MKRRHSTTEVAFYAHELSLSKNVEESVAAALPLDFLSEEGITAKEKVKCQMSSQEFQNNVAALLHEMIRAVEL